MHPGLEELLAVASELPAQNHEIDDDSDRGQAEIERVIEGLLVRVQSGEQLSPRGDQVITGAASCPQRPRSKKASEGDVERDRAASSGASQVRLAPCADARSSTSAEFGLCGL